MNTVRSLVKQFPLLSFFAIARDEATNTLNSQPLTGRPRNRILIWSGRLLLTLIVLAVIGAIYQAFAGAADKRTYTAPGQLVDVGGIVMHIDCAGVAHANTPTVILEAGGGMMSAHWAWVQSALSGATQVCAYDRAGYGWSEASATPRDAEHIASELHTLLEQAGIGGPYVLVGHSIGGLYMRAFAEQYPDAVAGLVLVDSSHPDQMARSPEIRSEQEGFLRLFKIVPVLARLGIVRISGMAGATASGLPAPASAAVTALFGVAAPYTAMLAEMEAWESTTTQSRSATAVANKPLFVVSAGADSSADWRTLQTELTSLSSVSLQLVVDQATHQSLLTNEQDAQITSMAILQVVEAARSGIPLE